MRFRNVLHRRRSSNSNSAVVTLTVPKDELHLLTSDVGVAPKKQGVLLKYTNVVKRWKQREFRLDNGVLTYSSAVDSDKDTSDDSSPEVEPRITRKKKRKLRFLRRQTSKDEKMKDIRGSIILQFAVISADDSDPTRFAIDNGAEVYHMRAESQEERDEWVAALNASNEYFRGLIKKAVSRAKDRTPKEGSSKTDKVQVVAEGMTQSPNQAFPNTREDAEDSDDSILEDDGLKEAEHSRAALFAELRRVLTVWRGKWVDSGTVPEDEKEFLNMLAEAFKDRQDTSEEAENPTQVSARGLVDLVTWCLHVMQTNDELFERRLKADVTRLMASGLPVFPRTGAAAGHLPSKYGGADDDEEDSDAEFFDALSRAASSRASTVRYTMENLSALSRERNRSRKLVESSSSKMSEPSPSKHAEASSSTDTRMALSEVKRVNTTVISKGFKGRRTSLPPLKGPREKLNVFNILKDSIGKDLSKISIPISLNEPISFLQRLAEDIEYCELLDKGAAESNPERRLMYVAAMVISHYSSTQGRVGKPFNPLLGETACVIMPTKGKGVRFVAEQVSHHPPVSACYAEGSGGSWKYYNDIEIKNKFWGKSLEVFPTGWNHIEFPEFGDHYVFEQVTSCVHNIVIGRMWLDNYGEMRIVNKTNGGRCVINFNKTGWMSDSKSFGAIKGTVYDANGVTKIKFGGNWTKHIYEELPRGKRNYIWKVDDRPDDKATQSYNMTKWAITLNSPVEEDERPYVAPTDSRLRPDQRCLENGDFAKGTQCKADLENGQRQRRKAMEEKGEAWEPRWFKKVPGEDEGSISWKYGGEFFERQAKGDWSNCPDIFSCATSLD